MQHLLFFEKSRASSPSPFEKWSASSPSPFEKWVKLPKKNGRQKLIPNNTIQKLLIFIEMSQNRYVTLVMTSGITCISSYILKS